MMMYTKYQGSGPSEFREKAFLVFYYIRQCKHVPYWPQNYLKNILIHYLLDNIFIRFGSKLHRQNVGIPKGTNCDPLLADLFLFFL